MGTSNITISSLWFASTPSMSFALTALAHVAISPRIWIVFEFRGIGVPPWAHFVMKDGRPRARWSHDSARLS
jgi:hypothetical protein